MTLSGHQNSGSGHSVNFILNGHVGIIFPGGWSHGPPERWHRLGRISAQPLDTPKPCGRNPRIWAYLAKGKVFHVFFHDVLMLNLEKISMFHHGKHHGKHLFHLLNLKDLNFWTSAKMFSMMVFHDFPNALLVAWKWPASTADPAGHGSAAMTKLQEEVWCSWTCFIIPSTRSGGTLRCIPWFFVDVSSCFYNLCILMCHGQVRSS